MLILSLKEHFPARLPEWFMSGMLFMWGGYLVFHPEVFTQPATAQVMSGLAAMAGLLPPAAMWGLTAVVVGMIRGSALFINGAYTRTPLIRLITSFASAFVFTQVVIGLVKSGVANTGLPVYVGLVVLDIVSAYRAATDAVYAEKVRHDTKQELRRVQHRSLA